MTNEQAGVWAAANGLVVQPQGSRPYRCVYHTTDRVWCEVAVGDTLAEAVLQYQAKRTRRMLLRLVDPAACNASGGELWTATK